eukprot:1147913-Pelagomonas_calceolata.AAC.5
MSEMIQLKLAGVIGSCKELAVFAGSGSGWMAECSEADVPGELAAERASLCVGEGWKTRGSGAGRLVEEDGTHWALLLRWVVINPDWRLSQGSMVASNGWIGGYSVVRKRSS